MRSRLYPRCCTSAFCGRVECSGCRNRDALREFRAWVKANGAVQVDPIWSPCVYIVPPEKGSE